MLYKHGQQGMVLDLPPTAPPSKVQRPPNMRIGNTPLQVKESTKFLVLWWDSHLSFKKHISVLKTQCKEALNLMRVVAHLSGEGDRDTLLMLYRAIVRSKLDYGCVVKFGLDITRIPLRTDGCWKLTSRFGDGNSSVGGSWDRGPFGAATSGFSPGPRFCCFRRHHTPPHQILNT